MPHPSSSKAGSLTNRAEGLFEAVHADPAKGLAQAESFREEAISLGNVAAEAVALRAIGVATRLLGDPAKGLEYLDIALDLSKESGDSTLIGEAHMSRAGAFTYLGRSSDALRALAAARKNLTGVKRARAIGQQASVLNRLGRVDEARECFDEAIESLEAAHDYRWEAITRANRALLLAWQGDVWSASEDLHRVRSTCRKAGLTSLEAEATHNLGFVATRAGDFPAALRHFDDAEEQFSRIDYPLHFAWPDRAEALLGAGLVREARPLLEATIAKFAEAGLDADAAESTLMLAHACLLDDDADAALETSRAATRSFRRQRRPGWVAQGLAAEMRARWMRGELRRDLPDNAISLSTELDHAGQALPAAYTRFIGLEAAAALGRGDAVATLSPVVRRAVRSGPIEVRVGAWLATARARMTAGQLKGADAAARAGLRLVDEYRATLGATDVRVGVATHAAELAELGVGLALDASQAKRVFNWVERARAAALLYPPARPPGQRRIARSLAELRRLAAELRASDAEGTTTASQVSRLRRLQQDISALTRRSAGASGPVPRTSSDDVIAAVGQSRLLQIFDYRGELGAVAVDESGMRLKRLGSADSVYKDVEGLRFGLRRLASAERSDEGRQAAVASCVEMSRRLDETFRFEGSRPLVVVPPARLHTLPWAALPSLDGVPLSVVPSASLWMHLLESKRRRRRVVLVAGPDLAEAAGEVRALAGIYPDATRFAPTRSKAMAVASALDGSAVAHVTCHGTYRADNPLFSSLEMADGPLYVHDLERLGKPPSTIVLSACDAGLTASRPGGEMMGLAASLLSMGTRTLIAGMGLVSDSAVTRRLMVTFHRALASGQPPSVALRGAIDSQSSIEERLAASSFTCLGVG